VLGGIGLDEGGRGVAFRVAALSLADAGKNAAALDIWIDATPGVFSPNAIHHPSGALHLASPFPPFMYAGKHCTPYLPISTIPENISPPKNNFLPLKRPIIRMLNQSMSHGIQMDINPLWFVRLRTQDLPVPKASLPDWPIAGPPPSPRHITFPLSGPIGCGDIRCGVLADEEMDVFQHDNITADGIIVVNIPGGAQQAMHFIAREDSFSVFSADGEEKDNDGTFQRREMGRMFSRGISYNVHFVCYNISPFLITPKQEVDLDENTSGAVHTPTRMFLYATFVPIPIASAARK
jgi:hypothetical protein